jgi:hypothetical protein
MITHDLRCNHCGFIRRDVMMQSPDDLKTALPCSCGGRYEITYLKFPGVIGNGHGWFKPGYNVQLGRSFSSFDEHEKYVKEKGLVVMGPEEAKRSRDLAHEPPEPKLEGVREAMEAAYHETFELGKMQTLKTNEQILREEGITHPLDGEPIVIQE